MAKKRKKPEYLNDKEMAEWVKGKIDSLPPPLTRDSLTKKNPSNSE